MLIPNRKGAKSDIGKILRPWQQILFISVKTKISYRSTPYILIYLCSFTDLAHACLIDRKGYEPSNAGLTYLKIIVTSD